MAHPLQSLRRAPWVPVLAVLSAFILVSGQVFNCCRLNQTVSEHVAQAVKSIRAIGSWDQSRLPASASEPLSARTHLGCHGLPPSAPVLKAPSPEDPAQSRIQGKESCLSEVAFSPQALQPVSVLSADLSLQAPALLPESVAPLPPRIERPRPQNKSSPPVYLLTRRLLV